MLPLAASRSDVVTWTSGSRQTVVVAGRDCARVWWQWAVSARAIVLTWSCCVITCADGNVGAAIELFLGSAADARFSGTGVYTPAVTWQQKATILFLSLAVSSK